jgi:hypothetical protein
MSLNNIELSSGQVAEFYEANLVITGITAIKTEVILPEQSTSGITGKNKKKLIWLVNEPAYPLLADEEFSFLGDILAACKMNMEDIALINYAQYQQEWKDFQNQLQPQIVILSAVPSLQLPVTGDEYKPVTYNKIQFLFTGSLSAIRQNRALKGQLWTALKQMLGI